MKKEIFIVVLILNSVFGLTQIENVNEGVDYETKLSKFNLNFEYGFAYVLDELEGNRAEQEYYFDLYKSRNFAIGGVYFLNEKHGLGLLYSQIWSQNTLSDVTIIIDQDTTSGVTISDKIKTNFFGPQYVLRLFSKSGKTKYNFGGAMGFLSLNWEQNRLIKTEVRAYTLGMRLTAGVDVYIAKGVDLGLNLFLQNGEADYVYIDDEPFTLSNYGLDPITLSRIGFNMGVKFLF